MAIFDGIWQFFSSGGAVGAIMIAVCTVSYIFFVTFLLLIRQQADEQPILFSVSLILGSIILAISAFLLNKCKKAQPTHKIMFRLCLYLHH